VSAPDHDQCLLSKKFHQFHSVYLHFYLALSLEAMARGMHSNSNARLQTLQQSRSSYEAAAATLPVADCGSELLDSGKTSPNSTPFVLERCGEEPSPCHSEFSHTSDDSEANGDDLRPSPLRIRKRVSFKPCAITSTHFHERSLTPPCTPPPGHKSIASPSPASPREGGDYCTKWRYNRAYQQYCAHLRDFADEIKNHIITVDRLIKATREAQATRCTAKTPSSYQTDDEAKLVDLEERIARMKAKGWHRERFDPGQYQNICAVALAEL